MQQRRPSWIGTAFKETGSSSGRVKELWGKLTDDDLAAINGRRDRLEGRIQERYGYAKNKPRDTVDEWLHSLDRTS
jgi:uncharacterized protein YjbJ (UPF0337 family)